MTNIEKVRLYFERETNARATNAQLVRVTGIRPHQQMYQITQKLVAEGYLTWTQRDGREKVFYRRDGDAPPAKIEVASHQ